ncbi:MAG: hypothetical protein ABS46_18580 [Cytophagaceae bacterium SCN 52-12]|nr:MAG: hypothetical protein ABS46_18580 [Cytophagaceae bacterium SCN 52-12]
MNILQKQTVINQAKLLTMAALTGLVMASHRLAGQDITIPVPGGEQVIEAPSAEQNYTYFTARKRPIDEKWLKYNPAERDHPDAAFIPAEQPAPGAIEVLGKRSETTRYFIDADNPSRVFSQSAYGALHYRKDGRWLLIDRRLDRLDSRIIEASRQPEPVGFDLEKKHSYIRTAGGVLAFNTWTLYGRGKSGKILLASADWTHLTAGDDGVWIKDIFPGVDAEMSVDRGQIKTNLVVRKWEYPQFDEYVFEDAYVHEKGIVPEFENEKKAKAGIGSVTLSTGGKKIASVGEAFAYSRQEAGTRILLPYELEDNRQGILLTYHALMSLLASGPFVIDPLVKGAQSGLVFTDPLKSYNASADNRSGCSEDFREGCSYSWKVEVPGKITVTNIIFSGRIRTISPCTRDKMFYKYRLGGGTCGENVKWLTEGNPATPGDTGGGDYPTDYYNACFQPGCEPTWQDVRLSILRSCMGDSDCGDNCVRGIGPFVITVEGRTLDLEFYKALPGYQVCHGDEIQLIAKGGFGMPEYTYRWSPGNMAGDTVHVTPGATTDYTLSVTDACNTTVTEKVRVEVSAPVVRDSLEVRSCGAVQYNGRNYTQSEVVRESLKGRSGCDSVERTVRITVYPLDPKEEKLALIGCEHVDFEGIRYRSNTKLEDTFTNAAGCDSVYRTVDITIQEFELDLLSSVHKDSLFIGEIIELKTAGNRSVYKVVSWEPPEMFPDQGGLSQKVKVPADILFTVRAESEEGCADSASIRLVGREIPASTVYPSSFTPNSDGNNDYWTPVRKIDQLEVWVYNRWGECVYYSNESDHKWDGTYKGVKLPAGTYAYRFLAYGRFRFFGQVNIFY